MGATTGWLRLQMCVMRGGGRVQEIMGDVDFHFGIVRPLRALALAPRSALLL